MTASPINTPLMPPDLPSTNDWSLNESSKNCHNAVRNSLIAGLLGAIGLAVYWIDLQETSSNDNHEEDTDHSSRRNLSHSEAVKSAAVWIFVVLALAATRYMEGCLLGLFSDRAHPIRNSQENPINPINNTINP